MSQGRRLFFIMGARKSGTTWLQKLVDQHPNLLCRGEGIFHQFGMGLSRTVREYNIALQGKSKIFGASAFPPLRREEFRALFRTFVLGRLEHELAAEGQPNILWAGEKDPDHAAHAALMMSTFPEAAFIHVIRDGRDVAVSWWHHVHRFDSVRASKDFPDFRQASLDAVREWAQRIRNARREQARTGVHYHELRYESLVADPEATLGAIFRFLEVSDAPDVVQRCVEAVNFLTLSGGRAPGQEDRSSFFRKGIVGDWRNYMEADQVEVLVAATDGLLSELGYDHI